MISETKLDESVPIGQFQIEGFSAQHKRDRDKNGGGILLYIREEMALQTHTTQTKYPHSNLIETHLNCLSNGFDHFSGKFNNCILFGDFNSETSNKYLIALCESLQSKITHKESYLF